MGIGISFPVCTTFESKSIDMRYRKVFRLHVLQMCGLVLEHPECSAHRPD